MIRRPATGIPAVVAAALCAVAASGCGSSGPRRSAPGDRGPANVVPSSGSGTLRVNPRRPSVRSTVAFTFRAPVASGVHGARVIAYSLSLVGFDRPGCVGAHEATVASAPSDGDASVSVDPGELGGSWCPGRWTARVIELERPHCAAGTPCPQYVRVVAIVARGSFTIGRG